MINDSILNSMTAFARRDTTLHDKDVATWEIKTLNHRYLDLQFRLPAVVQSLEPTLRSYIKSKLKKGRIEIKLHYQATDLTNSSIILNEAMVTQLSHYHQKINQLLKTQQKLDSFQVMNWKGVLQPVESTSLAVSTQQALVSAFEQTITEICKVRAHEGGMIQKILADYLKQLRHCVAQIANHIPKVQTQFYQRLQQRFNESKLEIASERFEQELVFMLRKMDISEELDRLKIHLEEFERQLTNTSVQGARLDFLMQELNREANTIASKSTEATLNLVVVDIKVIIEAMREQIQNVE